jgi:hypothetical protein
MDGDIVMLTDNDVLVRKLQPMPALICSQRKAEKRISTEKDFIRSNIESFGNDIGQTTNWITSMFEVQAGFEPGSKEYDELAYRIRCGQLYQQNAIDKAKGIVCKPMPKEWHDRHAVNKIEDEYIKNFYRSVVADKKPYFMRYIYPALMRQYNTYLKNTDRNALREFQLTVDELLKMRYDELTERQREFLKYYHYRMPVGVHDCVMNKICRRFEDAFDRHVGKHAASVKFDYHIMRNKSEYTPRQYKAIQRLYTAYNKRLNSYAVFADYERVDEYDSLAALSIINEEFRKECSIVCPDQRVLCNIVLDMCYTKKSTKRFAWSMCGSEIIHNLLLSNNNKISFPTLNECGEIEYCGNKYTIETTDIEVNE